MAIETLSPRTREEWLSLRRSTVGASEVASLFSIHPWLTPFALYHAKAGTLPADVEETAPMRRGRHLEKVAIDFLREERPEWAVEANVVPGGRFYRDMEIGISSTPDAFITDDARNGFGACQIKSVEASVFRKTWKTEDGSIEPPLYVAIQAIQDAMLCGASWAIVCPIVVSYGIDMPIIEVPLHQGLIGRIKSEVAAFWRGVREGKPPDVDYERDGRLLEDLFEGAGSELDLSARNDLPELADERERLAAERGAAEKRLKIIKAEMLAALGESGSGRLADGRLITAKRVFRKAYSVAETDYVDLRIRKAGK